MGGYWQKFLGWSSATTRSALRVASHTTNLGRRIRGVEGCQLPLPPKFVKLQGQSRKMEVEEPLQNWCSTIFILGVMGRCGDFYCIK